MIPSRQPAASEQQGYVRMTRHSWTDCCRASYMRLVMVSPRIPLKNAVRSQFSRITILRLKPKQVNVGSLDRH